MSDPKNESAAPSGKLVTKSCATFSGIQADILMGGEMAPMTVMTMTVASEQGAPAHISHREDKVFYIMKGNLIFSVGNNKIKALPGEVIFVGRGVAHSFSALNGVPAAMMLIASPARHDRFFAAMDALKIPHDPSEVQAVCELFEQSIVGPVVKY